MTPSRRIIISGYYGFSNTGDEAVLSAIIRGLNTHLDENVEITVLSASRQDTEKVHNIAAIDRMSYVQVSQAVKDSDLVISGGGSLIQDATSFRSLMYYLGVIRLAKKYGRKTMILGQGIGPLRRAASRFFARQALNRADMITVRDSESAELLAKLGVNKPPVKITADPAFLLEPCSTEEADNLLAEVGLAGEDDIIAVSLRTWHESPRMQEAAVEALEILSKKLTSKLLLIAMQSPDDQILVQEISKETGVSAQAKIWTPSQMLGIISRCELVIGMRLHSLIFASSAGVPFVGIDYDPKVRSFLTTAGQQGVSLDEMTSGMLVDRVLTALESREVLQSNMAKAVFEFKKAAKENFELAASLLEG